jgi:hypothetical protein
VLAMGDHHNYLYRMTTIFAITVSFCFDSRRGGVVGSVWRRVSMQCCRRRSAGPKQMSGYWAVWWLDWMPSECRRIRPRHAAFPAYPPCELSCITRVPQ